MTFLDPYLSYIRLYVDWRTGVSFGVVLALLAAVLTVSYLTRNRSS